MSEFVEKKIKKAKVLCFFLVVSAALYVTLFVALGFVQNPKVLYLPILTSVYVFVILVGVYLIVFQNFMSSVKWLKRRGLENIADDIILERPTLPRSKIYCGRNALFCKKPCAIIPYADIAWTYLYERRAYGFAVEKAVIIFTKDGKKFSLRSNPDEFKWLLENYIIANSPDLVIGYGAAQKAKYKQFNPEVVKSSKKRMLILGTVLMSIGAVLLTAGLINKTLKVPGLVLVLGLLGSGIVLCVMGKKKREKD